MSVKRRLAAAGLPAAGVTVFAALALTGQPAGAAVDGSAFAARQGVAAGLAATCDPGGRTKCGYAGPAGYPSDDSDDDGATSPNGTGDTGGTGGTNGGADDDRGNGDGYGGESPSPTPTPSGGTDNVPPGGAGPATTPPGGASPDSVPNGNGGGTLPVTGAPMGTITTVGGLLTAAGAALCFGVWYNTRRRRRA